MLAAYVDGRLTAVAIGEADRHVDACGSCRRELSALAAMHTLPAATGRGAAPALGRYVLIRELGHGAMGTVYRAYDPELDRSVAVKVLHELDAEACTRLRREAQAMARLAHPNVVSVYDVVAEGDVVFVAMELVEGGTLRTLAEPRQVFEACLAAGRGIAAAHAAKLVHRDVKPENVLCGADGRVAVSDFGLARSFDDDRAPQFAGTPAYMAPEVYLGEPASPASDGFSFCAMTYEMLYGQRAFAGDDLAALRSAIVDGQPREPPVGTKVPAYVARVLLRGLARDPAARWPGMTELVDALAVDPAARRRRRIAFAAAVGGALVVGGVGVYAAIGPEPPSCAIDPGELARAWGPERRAAVDAAVRAAGSDPVRIDAALDAYASRWALARQGACEATRVRGTDSDRVLEARNACLDRARGELGALTELLAGADRRLADHAVDAVYHLRDPASCRADLVIAPALPQRDEVDRARALSIAGRYEEADARAAGVLASLPPGVAPQLEAEALLVRMDAANIRTHAEDAKSLAYDALAAAERARDDRLVAQCWISLVGITGNTQHEFALAAMAMRGAEAAMARVDDDSMVALFHNHAGFALLAENNLASARDHLRRALAFDDKDRVRPGAAGIDRSALCDLETRDRHYDLARELCAASLPQLESAFGPDHTYVGVVLVNTGNLELAQEHLEPAERAYTRAVHIFEHAGYRDHLAYALAIANLGLVAAAREDFAHAQPLLEQARNLFAAHAPSHPLRIVALAGLADAAYNRGDFATSIRYYEEVRDVVDRYARNSEQSISALYSLSNAYTEHHDLDKANAVLDDVIARATAANNYVFVGRALEGKAAIADQRDQVRAAIGLRERALAAFDRQDDAYGRAWTEQMLGDSYLALGNARQAVPPLEHAVAHFAADPAHRYESGSARFSLARALWGRDSTRAIALARAAKADLAAVNVRDAASQLAVIDAWLTSHR
jgi:tetratricopeptide (TPR) repeat protein